MTTSGPYLKATTPNLYVISPLKDTELHNNCQGTVRNLKLLNPNARGHERGVESFTSLEVRPRKALHGQRLEGRCKEASTQPQNNYSD